VIEPTAARGYPTHEKRGTARYAACMKPIFGTAAVCIATLLLTACGSLRRSVVVEPAAGQAYDQSHRASMIGPRATSPVGSYSVHKGDTLYSIAFRNGVDFRNLAQWNGISAPYTIWPGQRLRLQLAASPTTTVAARAAGSLPSSPHASAISARSSASSFKPAALPVAPNNPTPGVSTASAVRPAVSATSSVVPVAGVPAPVALRPPLPVSAVVPAPSHQFGGVTWRWPAQGSLIKRFQSGDAIPGIEVAGNAGDPVRAAADGVVVYSGNGLVGYGELVIIKHSDTFLSAYGHNSKRLVKEGQRVTAGQPIAEIGSTGAARNELEFQIRKDGNPVDPLDYLPPR
jgi:lipoprotein NlpD